MSDNNDFEYSLHSSEVQGLEEKLTQVNEMSDYVKWYWNTMEKRFLWLFGISTALVLSLVFRTDAYLQSPIYKSGLAFVTVLFLLQFLILAIFIRKKELCFNVMNTFRNDLLAVLLTWKMIRRNSPETNFPVEPENLIKLHEYQRQKIMFYERMSVLQRAIEKFLYGKDLSDWVKSLSSEESSFEATTELVENIRKSFGKNKFVDAHYAINMSLFDGAEFDGKKTNAINFQLESNENIAMLNGLTRRLDQLFYFTIPLIVVIHLIVLLS